MPKLLEMADQLNGVEKIMDSFYRCDPVEESNTLQSQAVDSFNEWVKTSHAELEAESVALEHQLEPINQIEAQIASFDQRLERERPDPHDVALVEAYNG